MEKITTTLPLNPKHTERMGFLSFFMLVEQLANKLETQSLPMLQTGGQEFSNDTKKLIEKLRELGVDTKAIQDDKIFSNEVVQDVLTELFRKKVIYTEKASVVRCNCGKMQFLEIANLFKTKKTLLGIDGLSACCKSILRAQEETVLMVKPIEKINQEFLTIPSWLQKEIAWFGENMSVPLLISRLTPQKYEATVNGVHFFLDQDHLFYFYLLYYTMLGKKVDGVVAGVSIVKQISFMLHFGNLLKISLPKEVYSIPKINFKNETPQTFKEMIEKYGEIRVRNAILWAALSERKEISIEEDNIRRASNFDVPLEDSIDTRKKL